MTAAFLSLAWAVYTLIDFMELYRNAAWRSVRSRYLARSVFVAAFPAICVYVARSWP